MRRILLLTTTLLLTIVLLPSTAVHTQQTDEEKSPPNPDNYPAAAANCKRTVSLSPWLGTPAVEFTKTARCVLTITTCSGTETHTSGVRAVGATLCDDYWAVHQALAAREMCCDGKDNAPGKKNCDSPPPPWFTSSDCKDLQDPVVEQTRETVTIYLCGYRIFSGSKPRGDSSLYQSELQGNLRRDMPRKVCCNRFRDAARTGRPCDARADVDCDGIPNDSDRVTIGIPQIDGRGFSIAEEAIANYDLFPGGMSEDEIMPPAGDCKGCKWELIKGELSCSPDGISDHKYTATWRCPSSGVLTEKTHRARATAPCTPPTR